MILRYRPSESVTHESELQRGERWSTQAKRWTATGIARDLCCSHCGKMIVEEDKTVFYMRSMTGAGTPTYSHAWCHMVNSVNVDSMHHADGDYGDCMRRFVDEVARSLTVEDMAFPSMRCYQKFLTALIYFELCDHDEECPCSAENCSRLLTEDLKPHLVSGRRGLNRQARPCPRTAGPLLPTPNPLLWCARSSRST